MRGHSDLAGALAPTAGSGGRFGRGLGGPVESCEPQRDGQQRGEDSKEDVGPLPAERLGHTDGNHGRRGDAEVPGHAVPAQRKASLEIEARKLDEQRKQLEHETGDLKKRQDACTQLFDELVSQQKDLEAEREKR